MSKNQPGTFHRPLPQQDHPHPGFPGPPKSHEAPGDRSGQEPPHGTSEGVPEGGPSEAIFGPFGIRDVVILASVLLLFIGSLLPLVIGPSSSINYWVPTTYYDWDTTANFWGAAALFFLGIGILLPILLAVLVVVSRMNQRALRVGSLTLDQFGSVVAVLAFAYFFLSAATVFQWPYLIALIGTTGLMIATVCASWVPAFTPRSGRARAEASFPPATPPAAYDTYDASRTYPAAEPHNGASEQSAVDTMASTYAESVAKPKPSHWQSSQQAADVSAPIGHPVTGQPAQQPKVAKVPQGLEAVADYPVRQDADRPGDNHPATTHDTGTGTPTAAETTSIAATVDPSVPSAKQTGYRAFWFAVDSPRSAVDEDNGMVRFLVEPGIWFLALEDRGHEFLVQSPDGQVALLRDLRNVERAPEE